MNIGRFTTLNGPGTVAISIPRGDGGIEATVRWIRYFVDQALRNADVNRLAIAFLEAQGAREHDQRSAAKAIFDSVRAHFRFVPDIVGKETLRPIEEILSVRAGDCDDLNGVLVPALLLSVGIPVRLVTVAADEDRPEEFSHIYPEALIDGEWVAVDVARPGARFGREPEFWLRKRIWAIIDVDGEDIHGMNGLAYLRREAGLGQIPFLSTQRGGGINFADFAREALRTVPSIIAAGRAAPGVLPLLNLSQGIPIRAAQAAAQEATQAAATQPVSNSLLSGISPTTVILGVVVLGGFLIAAKAISRR